MSNLILKGRIKTTVARAKETRILAERLISYAKVGDKTLAARLILRYMPKNAAKKLMGSIASKYSSRRGGYTRIIKIGQRKGDAAEMAYLELI